MQRHHLRPGHRGRAGGGGGGAPVRTGVTGERAHRPWRGDCLHAGAASLARLRSRGRRGPRPGAGAVVSGAGQLHRRGHGRAAPAWRSRRSSKRCRPPCWRSGLRPAEPGEFSRRAFETRQARPGPGRGHRRPDRRRNARLRAPGPGPAGRSAVAAARGLAGGADRMSSRCWKPTVDFPDEELPADDLAARARPADRRPAGRTGRRPGRSGCGASGCARVFASR